MKKEDIVFCSAFLISLFLHLLLIVLNSFTFLNKIILNEKLPVSTIPLVVDLQQQADTLKIQNVNLLSKNSQKGAGKITAPNARKLNAQHLLGKTHYLILLGKSHSDTAEMKQLQLKKKARVKEKVNSLKNKESDAASAENEILKNLRKIKTVQTGIETVNSFTMQFNFDEANLKKIGVNAYIDSDFINNLGQIFNKQLKSYFVNHAQNFFFLKNDHVKVLATVDRSGQINFVDYLVQSTNQNYMNYLIKKMVHKPERLHFLPEIFKRQNREYIHLTVQVSYSGPPLYHIIYTIGH